jgi:tRNA A37 threonylcarbamoyladenosine biosynthesis protein TsaE
LGEIKTLEDNTKKLAEMIFQGVNNYTIHAPCLTMSTYDTALVDVYNTRIDHQVDASELSKRLKNFAIGSVEWDKVIEDMAKVWIQTDYKLTTQANGLSQLTVRWIGADEAREELYPKESANLD